MPFGLEAMKKRNFVIDCDTGRDDAIALWGALGAGGLQGVISSYGNVRVSDVVENNLRVLHVMGAQNTPVFKGASKSLLQNKGYHQYTLSRQKVSGNGLCNVELPAHDRPNSVGEIADWIGFIQETAEQCGKLDYIILGPATNFAFVAGALGPEISRYINSVIMLGGKVGELWDATPVPDFNVISDTDAFQSLLNVPIEKKLITLDTTWDIALSLDEILQFEPASEVGKWAKEIMISQCRHFAPEPIFRFHDPSVIFLYDKDGCFIKGDVTFDNQVVSPSFGRVEFSPNPLGCVNMFDYNKRSCPRDIALSLMGTIGLIRSKSQKIQIP